MDIDNLKLRFKTALLILPIFFLPIYLGGIYFKIALICVSTLFFYELITIINNGERKVATIIFMFSVLIFIHSKNCSKCGL